MASKVSSWLDARMQLTNSYSSTAKVALGPYPFSPSLSFTHGSLRPSYENLLPYPEKINELGHSLLTRALTLPMAPPHPPNPYSGLPRGTTQEEMDLYSAGGPYWWRGLAEVQDDQVVCQWAEELKEKLGVRRVIGVSRPCPCRSVLMIRDIHLTLRELSTGAMVPSSSSTQVNHLSNTYGRR
jgi:hypothetical protein